MPARLALAAALLALLAVVVVAALAAISCATKIPVETLTKAFGEVFGLLRHAVL